MKNIITSINVILVIITINSCSFLSLPENIKPIKPNSVVSATGIVVHLFAGGSKVYPGITRHSGYILKYPIWQTVYDVENRIKFLEPDSVAKKFEGMEVFISGYFERIPTFYYEDLSSQAGYDVIHINEIYSIK